MPEGPKTDVWFAIPGDPNTLTGGYIYARRVAEALPGAGWNVHPLALPGTFPSPSPQDLEATRRALESVPATSTVLIDGLAFGAMPPTLFDGLDLNIVALVHHPLALETGLSDEAVKSFRASERAALALASAVIATSQHTGGVLFRDYAVPYTRLVVAPPGAIRAPRASGQTGVPCVLTVAAVTHRKGPDVLVEALARIKDIPWRSVWVGSLERDPATVAAARKLLREHGLEERVTFAGELADDALEAAYAQADVFVLPSRYEGYGMAFAEALVRGLPIVACATGAVTGTVPPDAGYLVPPDDPAALAMPLRKLLSDKPLRQTLSENAWKHGEQLPKWTDTARRVANALYLASGQSARKDHGHGGHSHSGHEHRRAHDHHHPQDHHEH